METHIMQNEDKKTRMVESSGEADIVYRMKRFIK
jgi:hypothetical protein